MRVAWKTNGLEVDRFTENFVNRKLDAFSRRAKRWAKEGYEYHVKLESNGKNDVLFDLDAKLNGHHLHVHKSGHDVQEAAKKGMQSLFSQLDKLRLQSSLNLRRALANRKRKTVADRQSHLEHKMGPLPSGEEFKELYNAALWLATHELAYRQALGDLEPGYVDAADIVDEVFLEMLEDKVSIDALAEGSQQIKARTLALLDRKVKEMGAALEEDRSTDEDVPEYSEADELTNLGDQVLDFWAVDEDLLLEDMIPDVEKATPEEIAMANEGRDVLLNALMQIPQEARLAFGALLQHRDPEKLRLYLGNAMDECQKLATEAASKLKEILSGPRYKPSLDDIKDLYRSMAKGISGTFH